MTAMLFSLGYEGTGKTPKPEVERPGPEVARLMTSADKNRGHLVQTGRQPAVFHYYRILKIERKRK